MTPSEMEDYQRINFIARARKVIGQDEAHQFAVSVGQPVQVWRYGGGDEVVVMGSYMEAVLRKAGAQCRLTIVPIGEVI